MKRHSPIVASSSQTRIGSAVLEVETPLPIAPKPGAGGRDNPQPNPGGASVPASVPASRSPGLKKVSFGAGIAKKSEDTRTAYPVMPKTRDSDEVVDRILDRTEQLEALTGALETDKAELKSMATPCYFSVNHGRHEVPSSIACLGKSGREVVVTFQNRYPLLPDESGVLAILGEGRCGTHFRQSFELKIKGDKLPEDKTQQLMDELQALFARYGAGDALELKEGVKPVANFHELRHLQLSVAENLALDAACPIVAMVKTKGRSRK